jgi:hypothetical protein
MQRLVVVALLSALLILAGCTGVCRHQYGTYDPRTMTVVVTNTGPTATQVKVTVKAYSCQLPTTEVVSLKKLVLTSLSVH